MIATFRKELIALQIMSGQALDKNDIRCILSLLLGKKFDDSVDVFAYKAIRGRGRTPGTKVQQYIFMAQEYERLKEELGTSMKAYAALAAKFPEITSESRIKGCVKQGRDAMRAAYARTEDFLIQHPEYDLFDIFAMEVSKK